MTNTPEPAGIFRSPSAATASWWWRLEDSAGREMPAPDGSAQLFPSQSDAESWVGEAWPALLESGVAQVTLFELEREVYGPMKLSA